MDTDDVARFVLRRILWKLSSVDLGDSCASLLLGSNRVGVDTVDVARFVLRRIRGNLAVQISATSVFLELTGAFWSQSPEGSGCCLVFRLHSCQLCLNVMLCFGLSRSFDAENVARFVLRRIPRMLL